MKTMDYIEGLGFFFLQGAYSARYLVVFIAGFLMAKVI